MHRFRIFPSRAIILATRKSDNARRWEAHARHLGHRLTAAALLLAPSAVSAQNIPGIDTVKVKTITIGPTGKPMAAPTPGLSAEADKPASPVGLPAPVRVRTLRVGPKGHIVRDIPGKGSLPKP